MSQQYDPHSYDPNAPRPESGEQGTGYGQQQPSYGGQQPSYGPPSYGYQQPYGGYSPVPGYGYPPVQKTEENAAWALGLSIASWVLCAPLPLLAVVALYFVGKSDRAIAASGGTLGGAGMAKAARIISWIHIGLFLVAVVFFLVLFVILGVASSSS